MDQVTLAILCMEITITKDMSQRKSKVTSKQLLYGSLTTTSSRRGNAIGVIM